MRHWFRVLVWLVAFAGISLRGQEEILDPLPQPLKLPPGLEQTLTLNKTASFFGDSLRAVDCADDKDLPFGSCGNDLFGGLVMTDSHLEGNIRIRFFPPVKDIAHFEVIHGTLHGDDGVLQSPTGYELPVLYNQVSDAPFLSEGDLDLTTGGVRNLKYFVLFRNSALDLLLGANGRLDRPIVAFPFIRGHAWARFEQRPDGLLDYTFRGSTFLALGKDIQGDPVRFPMPFCNPVHCASVLARGTSLHPHLYLSTKEPEGPPCGANCPDIPSNTIREFTVFTHSSSFGDDFDLEIPQLGGPAGGRSHLLGRLQIQFGPRSGDTVYFVLTGLVPSGLLAEPPENPLFGKAFKPGLLGQEEFLRFPRLTYYLQKVALVDEPLNFTQGAVNLKTGRVIGEMEYPSYFLQNLALVLLEQNDGRISSDPFFLQALRKPPNKPADTYALFEKGVNGQLVFRYSGEHKRSFASFRWPSPDFVKANSFIAGPRSTLDLFLRLQAMSTTDTPRARKTGGAPSVLSSIGDRFSYSYSIPCNPAGATFSFEYTNFNSGKSGGTFRMNRLAAVQCTNSRTSNLPPGDYDTITFSGFGTWSKDKPDSAPRFASVQISTSPDFPYVGVLVFQNPDADDNVILSSANTKPAEKPLP